MSLDLAGPWAKSLAGLSRCSASGPLLSGREHHATLSAGIAVRFAATGAPTREAASAVATAAAARGHRVPWADAGARSGWDERRQRAPHDDGWNRRYRCEADAVVSAGDHEAPARDDTRSSASAPELAPALRHGQAACLVSAQGVLAVLWRVARAEEGARPNGESSGPGASQSSERRPSGFASAQAPSRARSRCAIARARYVSTSARRKRTPGTQPDRRAEHNGDLQGGTSRGSLRADPYRDRVCPPPGFEAVVGCAQRCEGCRTSWAGVPLVATAADPSAAERSGLCT